jgi:threonine/homoserine/homoserine lactone efflux protein
MSDAPRSERQVAFIAAAIVLLALPLVVMFGLAVIVLVTQASANAETKWLAWALFFGWVAIVVTVALAFAVRFVRRST